MVIKTYSELLSLKTFEDRFNYLVENGTLGEATFGGSRFINQQFYRSSEWRSIRDSVIIRDNGMDLGIDGMPINGRVVVHHMVPLKKEDFLYRTPFLVDPEYMITMSHNTHNAIHFGSIDSTTQDYVPRTPNDTCPWR